MNKLSNIIDKNNMGLYPDDCLGVFEKLSGPQINRGKRKLSKFLKTADCNNRNNKYYINITFTFKFET